MKNGREGKNIQAKTAVTRSISGNIQTKTTVPHSRTRNIPTKSSVTLKTGHKPQVVYTPIYLTFAQSTSPIYHKMSSTQAFVTISQPATHHILPIENDDNKPKTAYRNNQ